MKDVKNILIGLLAFLAIMQFVQFGTQVVPVRPLSGVVEETPWPGFSVATVSDQRFQDYVGDYSGYNFGFRPWFVRLNNQLYYSLFRQSPYPNLVIGKENYLYERPYLESYFGEDYLGGPRIDSMMMKLEVVRSFLERSGTELIVVIAPNKVEYFSEHIPDYLVREKAETNYGVISEKLKGSGYNVLDANAWFNQLKGKSEYPLMTRTGVHWSVYGSAFFADSLVGLMQDVLGKDLVRYAIDKIEYPEAARETDKDLEDLMNIFFSDRSNRFAYPAAFSHQPNDSGYKPDMVVIADSFFWNFYQGYFTHCVGDISFWYYFHSIFPPLPDKIATTEEIDVVGKACDVDVVLLVTSTDNMKDFGFGFFEYIYDFLQLSRDEQIRHLAARYEKSIHNDPACLDSLKVKTGAEGTPLDSLIQSQASRFALERVDAFAGAADPR